MIIGEASVVSGDSRNGSTDGRMAVTTGHFEESNRISLMSLVYLCVDRDGGGGGGDNSVVCSFC